MLDIKEKRHIQIVGKGGGGQAESVDWDNIENKPDFATVATSGSYNDLSDTPELFSGDYNDLTNKPNLATVATSGSYSDLSNTPSLATVATSGSYSDLSNTPNLATVATSGSYNDLINKPTIPPQQWFGTQQEYDAILVKDPDVVYNIEDNGAVDWSDITNKPQFATVATSGSYNDLSNKPTLATVATSGSYNDLSNTPSLATVATSGSYNDLSNTPSLATVATSGNYNDLTNTPNLATVATSGDYTDLSNTPNLAAVATSGSYNDLIDVPTSTQQNSDWNSTSGVTEILNKPELLTEKLTFTLQGGTTVSMNVYYNPGNYFYVENTSGSNGTLTITKYGNNAPTIEVFKSTDRLNWTSMGTTSTTPITATIPANGKLYLKATTDKWGTYNNDRYYNTINCNTNYNVGGNIMSLLYGDNFESTTFNTTDNTYAFSNLFNINNQNLVNAGNLLLPSTTLANNCYEYMFKNCSQLTTAPALPATTLADACYLNMFENCSRLTTAPATLPATTLASNCYMSMFKNCSSLTTAPTISATTLGTQCCMSMFSGCSALTKAPDLLATDGATPNSQLYSNMFQGCTSLVNPPVIALTSCSSYSLQYMFQNCTSLVRTPVLNITTLKNGCYRNMFDGCTSLTTVTTYANNISATDCLDNWLNNVAATGDFYNLGSATYTADSASGIPTGWTEHTSL